MKSWFVTSHQLPSSFKVEQVGFSLYANGMPLRIGGGSGFAPCSQISLQVSEDKLAQVEEEYIKEKISYKKEKSLFYS